MERVVAVCVGRASVVGSDRFKPVHTAFVKQAVDGPVRLTKLGFPGDEHVYEDHGGPDMAVLAYSVDNYTFWRDLGTVTGLEEHNVFLGDVYEVGGAVVQVCQPRSPCYKIAARYGRKDIAVLAQDSGRTGFLLRVLEEGEVTAGDEIRLRERGSNVSVSEAGRILNVDRRDLDGARRMLAVAALGSSTRRKLEARLRQAPPSGLDTKRLFDE